MIIISAYFSYLTGLHAADAAAESSSSDSHGNTSQNACWYLMVRKGQTIVKACYYTAPSIKVWVSSHALLNINCYQCTHIISVIQTAQGRIRWNIPAFRQWRIVVNQWPAQWIYDESIVKLTATNHLQSFIHAQSQPLNTLGKIITIQENSANGSIIHNHGWLIN